MKATPYLLAAVAVAALIVTAALFWRHQQPPLAVTPEAPPPVAATPPAALDPAASSASEPGVKHPIGIPERAQPAATVQDLDAALAELVGGKTMLSMLQTQDFARRFVATIDNLGRSHAPATMWPVNPTAGRLVVEKKDGADVIGSDNDLRYTPFVVLVETLDLHKAVTVYARLYPLFQHAYEDIGFPGHYFNDRLVEVIDQLLATPDMSEPLKVRMLQINGPVQPERPWVLYEFEDSSLQSLSAGQKILLRMGSANERRMKARLVEIRRLLTSAGPLR